MNTKYIRRLLPAIILILVFSLTSAAQRGRHDRYYNYPYYHYPTYYSAPYANLSFGYGSNYYRYYDDSYYAPYNGYYPGYYPRPGIHISILPLGYSRIYIGPTPYYYYGGIYYLPSPNHGYDVVAPPLNARVSKLPPQAKLRVIDGQKYYEFNGTFYREDIDGNNKRTYTVVGTDGVLNTDNSVSQEKQGDRIGDQVDKLPADCKAIIISDKKYYLAPSGLYYEEVTKGNKTYYEVVGKSSDMK